MHDCRQRAREQSVTRALDDPDPHQRLLLLGGTYSFPQDCIAQTILGVGLLTVIKDVGSEVTSDAFQLTLSPASLDGRTDLSIIGGQTITRIPVNADLDHTLTEAAPPPGWEFGSIDCLLNGTTTGTTVPTSVIRGTVRQTVFLT